MDSDFLCSVIESAFQYISKTVDLRNLEAEGWGACDEDEDNNLHSQRTNDFINHAMLIAHAFKDLIGLIISIAHRLVSSLSPPSTCSGPFLTSSVVVVVVCILGVQGAGEHPNP